MISIFLLVTFFLANFLCGFDAMSLNDVADKDQFLRFLSREQNQDAQNSANLAAFLKSNKADRIFPSENPGSGSGSGSGAGFGFAKNLPAVVSCTANLDVVDMDISDDLVSEVAAVLVDEHVARLGKADFDKTIASDGAGADGGVIDDASLGIAKIDSLICGGCNKKWKTKKDLSRCKNHHICADVKKLILQKNLSGLTDLLKLENGVAPWILLEGLQVAKMAKLDGIIKLLIESGAQEDQLLSCIHDGCGIIYLPKRKDEFEAHILKDHTLKTNIDAFNKIKARYVEQGSQPIVSAIDQGVAVGAGAGSGSGVVDNGPANMDLTEDSNGKSLGRKANKSGSVRDSKGRFVRKASKRKASAIADWVSLEDDNTQQAKKHKPLQQLAAFHAINDAIEKSIDIQFISSVLELARDSEIEAFLRDKFSAMSSIKYNLLLNSGLKVSDYHARLCNDHNSPEKMSLFLDSYLKTVGDREQAIIYLEGLKHLNNPQVAKIVLERIDALKLRGN